MKNKQLLYENLLNQHRFVSNKINEIKGRNFEPSKKDAEEIKILENRLTQIMNQMKVLFR